MERHVSLLILSVFVLLNDIVRYHTYPEDIRVDYPEGFQGTEIPVYGPVVAKVIEDRIEGRL
jgi:hypothetical protein